MPAGRYRLHGSACGHQCRGRPTPTFRECTQVLLISSGRELSVGKRPLIRPGPGEQGSQEVQGARRKAGAGSFRSRGPVQGVGSPASSWGLRGLGSRGLAHVGVDSYPLQLPSLFHSPPLTSQKWTGELGSEGRSLIVCLLYAQHFGNTLSFCPLHKPRKCNSSSLLLPPPPSLLPSHPPQESPERLSDPLSVAGIGSGPGSASRLRMETCLHPSTSTGSSLTSQGMVRPIHGSGVTRSPCRLLALVDPGGIWSLSSSRTYGWLGPVDNGFPSAHQVHLLPMFQPHCPSIP